MCDTHLIDPNQYIQSLSKIRKSIEKQLPANFKSKLINDDQLDKQISKNFLKYKKETLQKERIKLALQCRKEIQQKNKNNLEHYIEDKIKYSQRMRERRIRQFQQKKKIQRLTKEALIKQKRQALIHEKVQKSLETLQKLENKRAPSMPVNLRNLDSQAHSNKFESSKNTELQKIRSLLRQKKSSSFSSLQSCKKQKIIDSPQSNQTLITQITMNSGQSENSQKIKSKNSRIRSLSMLPKISDNRFKSKQEQALERLVEEKREQGYQRWLQKNSMSYKAIHPSHHLQIKQIIENYLKNHIKRVDNNM